MSILILIAFSIGHVKSQCDGVFTCTPSLPPTNDCVGEPYAEWRCSGFIACHNEDSLCAACCRADKLFHEDVSGTGYSNTDGLFAQGCQPDYCTTASPSESPSLPSISPTKYPSISPTEPSSAPSKYPSVPPTEPSSAPSKTPSVTPSNNPSVTPSNNPSVTPSVTPSNMPSISPTTASPVTSPVADGDDSTGGNEMISIVIPIVFIIIAFIVVY